MKLGEGNDFTDRTKYLERWENEIEERLQTDARSLNASRVLVLHGASGTGTSRLMSEFCERLSARKGQKPEIAYGTLDFADLRYHSPLEATLKLGADLRRQSGLAFPTLECAIAHLYTLNNPKKGILEARRKVRESLGGVSPYLDFLLERLGDAIGLAASGSPYVYFSLAFNAARNKLGNVLIPELDSWFKHPDVRAMCAKIEAERAPCTLLQSLPRYFGFDLRHALAMCGSPPRVIFMFDHLDVLQSGRIGNRGMADMWLRSLVQETPSALTAIFSRSRLQWNDHYDFAAQRITLEQEELDCLSEEDVADYMEKKAIDSVAVKERIAYLARGVPGRLARLADRFASIQASGRQPTVEDFGGDVQDFAEMAFSHMSEIERSHLRFASYLKVFDETLFLDLVDA